MDELPCKHVVAVLRNLHLNSYDYCSKYHTKSNLLDTYKTTVHPIPHESEWNIPIEVKEIIVLKPNVKIQAGRPRKKRIPAGKKITKKYKCRRCGQEAHNQRTCNNIPI